ncbi:MULTISPECIES: DMT family transporter [Glaesserella]|uniref:EamA/RhaT family transporter n=1 Tax=Glaesserella australis TaxID=2094024 RepID=A0A328BWV1_9PAST|nr:MULTISPECIES: DMT family transporter [Glaesserella]AUI65307.1 multidrug transporter [Glaesserella sp. 15-184]RAL18579.1 EamA/RhaT family transporter [Glaesserella australis]
MWKNPLILNFLYVFAIGLNIVLLRYFSLHFDALNNNGVRFTVGGLVLLGLVWLKYRYDLRKLIAQPKLALIGVVMGIMMCANMYFWLKGVALTNAVTASVSGVLAMPFGILVAAIFFQDERQKLKNKTFWIGSFLTISGALGFVWYGKTIEVGDYFLVGSFFLLLSILIRNVQNLLVKFINHQINVATLSFLTSLTAGLLSLLLSQQSGKLSELSLISTFLLISLILVGIYAIGAGMVLTFHIIQQQGIVTYQVLELLMPISTAFIAYLLLGEKIALAQLLFAVVVMIGASMALGLMPIEQKRYRTNK